MQVLGLAARDSDNDHNRRGESIGCHGAGCLVDNPDDADDPNNWPLCSGTVHATPIAAARQTGVETV